MLSGASRFTDAVVSIDQAGTFTCTDRERDLLGNDEERHVHGHRHQRSGGDRQLAADVTLTNAAAGTHADADPDAPANVNLGNSGSTALAIGGNISLDSTTADGVYTGTFAVTVNY